MRLSLRLRDLPMKQVIRLQGVSPFSISGSRVSMIGKNVRDKRTNIAAIFQRIFGLQSLSVKQSLITT